MFRLGAKRAVLFLIASLGAAEPRFPVFQFSSLPIGARSFASAGSLGGLPLGLESIGYNPAGLASPSRMEASFTFCPYAQDAAYLVGGLKVHRGSFGQFGVQAAMNVLGSYPASFIDGSGNIAEATQNLGLGNLSLEAVYALSLGRHVTAGAGLKYLSERFWQNVSIHGFAVDAGLQARLSILAPFLQNFYAGLSVLNLGLVASQTNEEMATVLHASLAFRSRPEAASSLACGADFTWKNNGATGEMGLSLGAELRLARFLSARIGYAIPLNAVAVSFADGLRFGMGFELRGASISYALAFRDAGPYQAVTLAYRVPELSDPSAKEALALYYLGLKLFEKGEYEGAILSFREALRLQPDFGSAKRRLDETEALLRREKERFNLRLKPNA